MQWDQNNILRYFSMTKHIIRRKTFCIWFKFRRNLFPSVPSVLFQEMARRQKINILTNDDPVNRSMAMLWCKTAASPLLTHWGYCNPTLNNRYMCNRTEVRLVNRYLYLCLLVKWFESEKRPRIQESITTHTVIVHWLYGTIGRRQITEETTCIFILSITPHQYRGSITVTS